MDEVGATSELILRDLLPETKYEVRVRVSMDGIAYSGFWSAWSDPVIVETLPAGELTFFLEQLWFCRS